MATALPFLFKTQRLLIRQLSLADADFIYRLLNSEGWLRYIGDRNITSSTEAEKYLREGPLKAYAEYGYGLYCVEELKSGVPMGLCGILNRNTLEYPDLGFAFLPEFTGKGYALEACEALLNHAHLPGNIHTLLAITLPYNTRSVGLLKKLGFVHSKDIQLPNDSDILQLYTLIVKEIR